MHCTFTSETSVTMKPSYVYYYYIPILAFTFKNDWKVFLWYIWCLIFEPHNNMYMYII